MTNVKWFDWNSGELIGEFQDSWSDSYEWPDLLCPKCGRKCEYCEGQIDQDIQGNDIHGCWWVCGDCRITSENEPL